MVFITDTDCFLCKVPPEVEEIVAHLNHITGILGILNLPVNGLWHLWFTDSAQL